MDKNRLTYAQPFSKTSSFHKLTAYAVRQTHKSRGLKLPLVCPRNHDILKILLENGRTVNETRHTKLRIDHLHLLKSRQCYPTHSCAITVQGKAPDNRICRASFPLLVPRMSFLGICRPGFKGRPSATCDPLHTSLVANSSAGTHSILQSHWSLVQADGTHTRATPSLPGTST